MKQISLKRRRPDPNSKALAAFARVKAGKKPTKLRKKSLRPTKTLIDRADRALQDWYRAKYRGTAWTAISVVYCEGCNDKVFDVMHHFYEKSQSAGLRYDDDNLIFLCNGCHFRHHRTGDQSIMSNVILRRGEAWHYALRAKRNGSKRGPFSRTELEALIEKYSPQRLKQT